jgi:hypothetical protein
VRPSRILALTVSAVLGVGLGIVAALALDQGYQDPLGLGAAMVNQQCQNNETLLVLASGDTSGALASDIASQDGARYLETAHSCDTAWRRPGRPIESYVAYLGPLDRRDACERQMTGNYRGAHVTELTEGSTDTVQCACYVARAGIPELRTGQDMTDHELVYLHDAQQMLTDLGIRPDEPITDRYDQEMESQVLHFQQNRHHAANGVMGKDTWRALLNAACDQN